MEAHTHTPEVSHYVMLLFMLRSDALVHFIKATVEYREGKHVLEKDTVIPLYI